MTRTLIYGGSFDPPTLAHEAIIRACLGLPGFAAVWVMPSCNRADKAVTTDVQHRLAMLAVVWRTAFGGDQRLVVSDLEARLGPPTQFCRTLEELDRLHPGTEFWFAFGGDGYRDMPNWEQADEFMPTIRSVVFTDHPLPTPSERVLRPDIAEQVKAISATQVRVALAHAGDVSQYVSEPVLGYIAEHGLYH